MPRRNTIAQRPLAIRAQRKAVDFGGWWDRAVARILKDVVQAALPVARCTSCEYFDCEIVCTKTLLAPVHALARLEGTVRVSARHSIHDRLARIVLRNKEIRVPGGTALSEIDKHARFADSSNFVL